MQLTSTYVEAWDDIKFHHGGDRGADDRGAQGVNPELRCVFWLLDSKNLLAFGNSF